jgi:hypothetical protein
VIKNSLKFAACIGILGAAVLANDAMALNQAQCQDLPGNMFLAAVERGDCDISIQTAAGPQEEVIPEDDRDRPRTRDGRNGGRGGGDTKGGGNEGGGRAGGRANP